jgi:hypothetical protein
MNCKGCGKDFCYLFEGDLCGTCRDNPPAEKKKEPRQKRIRREERKRSVGTCRKKSDPPVETHYRVKRGGIYVYLRRQIRKPEQSNG